MILTKIKYFFQQSYKIERMLIDVIHNIKILNSLIIIMIFFSAFNNLLVRFELAIYITLNIKQRTRDVIRLKATY